MAKPTRQANVPNVRFYVKICEMHKGGCIEEYFVDQCADLSSKGIDSIVNVMERHCDVMYRKTGLQYIISGWEVLTPDGDLEDF